MPVRRELVAPGGVGAALLDVGNQRLKTSPHAWRPLLCAHPPSI
jgi:hypothetical protein